jgi:hypothetical protein
LPLFPKPADGQLLLRKVHIAFDGLKHRSDTIPLLVEFRIIIKRNVVILSHFFGVRQIVLAGQLIVPFLFEIVVEVVVEVVVIEVVEWIGGAHSPVVRRPANDITLGHWSYDWQNISFADEHFACHNLLPRLN